MQAAMFFTAKCAASIEHGFRRRNMQATINATRHRLASRNTFLQLRGRHAAWTPPWRAQQPYHQRGQRKPEQKFHRKPRCNTTSSTKRLPTYASSSVAKPASVKLSAVLPRQPRQWRPASSTPNKVQDNIVNMVL